MWSRASIVASGFLAAVLFTSSPALAQGSLGPKLQAALAASRGENVAVIVTLADQVDPASFQGPGKGLLRAAMVQALHANAAATQGPVRQLLEEQGVTGVVSLWATNAVAARVPPGLVHALAALPGVASVKFDATLDAPWTTVATASVPEWNLDAIRAPELWALGHTGVGVVIASMDTGVDANHPDLAARWRAGSGGWFDPNGEHASPHDSDGHGTQTLGLALGGAASGSPIGVAPGAQWIAAKIFNDSGTASLSAIHQGFQWLLDPDGNPASDDAPDVVNNSWNFPSTIDQCYTEFEPDIQLLEAAGIAVVFSGGNQGPDASSSVSPANNAGALATGAVDGALAVADFSSRGPGACDGGIYPQLVAPGVDVITADLTFGGTFPDSYISAAGVSFAAPHTTGAIALLLGAFPDASVADARQALEDSAVDLGAGGPDPENGHGLIDVVEAFAALDAAPPPPLCTDADSDGYPAESDCGSPVDCNDADAGINPAACDIKRDGVDQDCDGADRRKGQGCPDSGGGGGGDPPPPPDSGEPEGKGKTCSDGIDNDLDGAIDCGDSDCARSKSCR
jgi:serine protease AprX